MRFLALLGAFLLCHIANASEIYNEEQERTYRAAYLQLNTIPPTEFAAKTSVDRWLIFFGSDRCPHCREYVPIWLEGQQYADELGSDQVGFHIGKVECYGPMDNENLCADEKIEGYPTMKLYVDGKAMEEPEEIRELDQLKAYIDKEVKKARAQSKTSEAALAELQKLGEAGSKARADVNPDGQLIHLTSADFSWRTQNQPWFIMFHAPWCGHCKALAPTWEMVAPALQGYVNVGKVDCTKYGDICKQHGVRGYPTLKFLDAHGAISEYSGERTYKALSEYARSFVSKPAFTVIKASEISKAISNNEVAFFFLYNPTTAGDESKKILNAFTEAAVAVRSVAKVFVSPDASAHTALKVAPTHKPVLVYAKDGGEDISAFSADLTDAGSIRDFITSNRLPLVPQLVSSNQDEIMGGDGKVVLLVIDPLKPGREAALGAVRTAAKNWGGSASAQQVRFAWINGKTYSKYIQRIYGLEESSYPAIVITDPKNDAFYNVDKRGKPIQVEAQALLDSIEDVILGLGKPKYTTGFFANTVRSLKTNANNTSAWIRDNFILTLFVVVAAVGICVYGGFLPGSGRGGYAKAE